MRNATSYKLEPTKSTLVKSISMSIELPKHGKGYFKRKVQIFHIHSFQQEPSCSALGNHIQFTQSNFGFVFPQPAVSSFSCSATPTARVLEV